MSKIYVPSHGPNDWQALLSEPNKQRKTGYSARTLAHCWERVGGLPKEVAALFGGDPTELLFAIPEHKVPLPGGATESQNDIFALIRQRDLTYAVTVEGKVSEPFGPTVGEWFVAPSDGKRARMKFLCDVLGLDSVPAPEIRYQLLHRTASALIEADRFKTDHAAMIVHSFSQAHLWFEDFAHFVSLFGKPAIANAPITLTLKSGRQLLLGWATGNAEFLAS